MQNFVFVCVTEQNMIAYRRVVLLRSLCIGLWSQRCLCITGLRLSSCNLLKFKTRDNPSQLFHSTSNIRAPNDEVMSRQRFDEVCNETLDSLTERFEDIFVSMDDPDCGDVENTGDVVTVQLKNVGTYVINKQTPNRQIWLSSPISGPKRFDYSHGTWIYNRTGELLHELLGNELRSALRISCSFADCLHAGDGRTS